MAPRYDPIRDAAPSSSRSPHLPSQASASPDSASVRSRIGSADSLNHVRRGSAAGAIPEGRYDAAREGHHGHIMERNGSHPGNGAVMSPRSSITGSPSQHYQVHPHYHQQQLHRPSSAASSEYANPPRRGASIHDLITASEIASANQAGRSTALSRSYSHQSDEPMERAPAASMSRSNSNSSQHYGYPSAQQQQAMAPQSRVERSPSMANLLNEGTAGAVHERPRSGSQSSVSSMISHPQSSHHAHAPVVHSHHSVAQSAPPAPPSQHHMLGHGHPSREALMLSRQRPGSSSASWGQSPPMAAPLPSVPRTSSSPAMGPSQIAHAAGDRARIFSNPAMASGGHPRSLSASYGYASVSSSPAGGAHQALHPSPTPQFVVPGLPAHRSPEARRNVPLPPSPNNVHMMPSRAPVTPGSTWGPGGSYVIDEREGGYPVSSPRRMSAAHAMTARFAPPTPGNGIPHTPESLPPTPGGLPPTPGARSLPPTTPGYDRRHAVDYFERKGHEYQEAHHHARGPHDHPYGHSSFVDEHERRMSASAARRPSNEAAHFARGSPASMIAASPGAESYRGGGPPPLPPVASSPIHGMMQARRDSASHDGAPNTVFDPIRGVEVARRPSSSSRSMHSIALPQVDPRRFSESSIEAKETKESPVSDRRASETLPRSFDGPRREDSAGRISIIEDSNTVDRLEARRRSLQMEARIREEERERSETASKRENGDDVATGEDSKSTIELAPAKEYPPSYRQTHAETISPWSAPKPRPKPASPSPSPRPPPRDEEMRSPTPKSVTPPPQPAMPAPLKYAPKKRISPPKMVMRPISMQEIDQKRSQCRNTLRLEWERENRTDSREPLDRILIEHHQKLAASVSSNVGGQSPKSTMKRKEEELLKDADEVAQHYNKRREVGIQGREESPIFGLRKFNNWIKSVMIGSFARGRDPSMDNRGKPRGGRILDLGCGKGGDLKKWDKVDPSALVGVDIAAISIEQATQRHKDNNSRFHAEFFAFDCFSRPLTDVVPRPLLEPMFDSVSLQFCMHYAWENVQKARVMLENVSKYLRRGGTFIGTIPDSVILRSRLERSRTSAEDRSFGNRYYKVVFDDTSRFPPFGNRYTFFLEDAVENVPEYVVEWSTFEALAHENGLRCVYRKNFADIYEEEARKPTYGKLLERMQVVDRATGQLTMDSRMWEAATLYMGFAFEKM